MEETAKVEVAKVEVAKVAKEKKAKVAKVEVKEKGKGVAVWQKGLRPLRDLVNLAQLNSETVSDKSISATLGKLARAERIRIEKTETIPARLNRRFVKFCSKA